MKKKVALDFSKLSPNFVLGLIVILSFIAGFLLGRITSVSYRAVKKEVKVDNQAPEKGEVKPERKKLSEIVKELNIDENKFKACLSSEKYKKKVDEQFNEGAKAGIRGTPGGVIFDLKTGNMQALRGAVPYEELNKMLSELKKGNTDPQAPKVKRPDPKTDHWRGPKDARFVLIEYSDFQCPFCDRFQPTATRFVKENKDVAWVYRHFPLRSIHPYAQKLAEASECVAEQKGEEGFWAFADKVFEAMPGLEVDYN